MKFRAIYFYLVDLFAFVNSFLITSCLYFLGMIMTLIELSFKLSLDKTPNYLPYMTIFRAAVST